ncbi:MAG: hypothetical protein HOV81_08400 [Kofleriaceae bacterium]|nr:hypothetical protein [Kofleriaceae bacterium]
MLRPDSGTQPDGRVIEPTVDAPVDAAGGAACTLVPQSGCSGATPACDLDAAGDTYCRAVTSQGTSNNHCSTATACKDGYTCVGDGTTNAAVCSRFCTQDTDCTGTGSRCVDDLTQNNVVVASVCSNACDPYGQTGCPTGMGCVPYLDSAGSFTDCEYVGTQQVGQSCTYSADCDDGLICVISNNVKTCRELCIVGNNATCSSGSCSGFTTPLTIGTVTYGSCR